MSSGLSAPMSLKSNSESYSNSSASTTEQNPWRIDNEEQESELMIVYDLDLDLDDCYLLGLPKFAGNIFQEMKLLEELDLEFEDLFLLGGLPKIENSGEGPDRTGSSVYDIPKQDMKGTSSRDRFAKVDTLPMTGEN